MMKSTIYDVCHAGISYTKTASFPWQKGRFLALKDVNFRVNSGDVVGIIGHNGAGKTTLLRLLAGILEPDNGKIRRAYDNIGILSFGSGFEDRLSGRQNIMLEGIQLKVPRRKIIRQMKNIIDLAGLGDFIDQPIKVYSAGMRARLGFSVAYYLHSEVLLIDEVFVAGDDEFQKKAGLLITEKIQSGITVVMVTHDMGVVNHLCTRVIQIEHGISLPELSVQKTIERYLQQHRMS